MAESGKSPSPEDGIFSRMHRLPILMLAVGVILLLAGIILHLLYEHNHWRHESVPYVYTFLREFGFALIIAYLITMGIEKTSRDRHNALVQQQIEIIQRNVFEAVYSTRQDKQLIQLLETEIFGRPFYRTGYEVRIVLKPEDVPEHEKVLRVETHMRYRVHNTTNKEQEFVFMTKVELPYSPKLAEIVRLKSLKVGTHVLTELELVSALDRQLTNEDFKRYKWPVMIPPHSAIDVMAEYVSIKYVRDAMTWQVYDPCDGLKVTVFHPLDILIFGDEIHSFEAEKSGGTATDDVFSIRIEKPLFPNNGVQIWWTPASAAAKEMNDDQKSLNLPGKD